MRAEQCPESRSCKNTQHLVQQNVSACVCTCVYVCVCVCVHMNVSMYFYNDAHVFALCVCTCIHVHRSDMCYPKIEWTGDPSTATLSMSFLVMFSRLGLFEGDMKFTMSKMSP